MAPLPTTVLAGVGVPNTPLIQKAIELARSNLDPITFNHVMRSWLFGFCIASKQDPGWLSRDLELHALAAILHDMGWSESTAFTSPDLRFEVDGANAARKFVQEEAVAEDWDQYRIQLLWDSIALHSTPSIALHRQPEAVATSIGPFADFVGVGGPMVGDGLTQKEWDQIVQDYPRAGLKEKVTDTFCGLCKKKPDTTYDNLAADFGEELVEGYQRKGKRAFDIITNAVD